MILFEFATVTSELYKHLIQNSFNGRFLYPIRVYRNRIVVVKKKKKTNTNSIITSARIAGGLYNLCENLQFPRKILENHTGSPIRPAEAELKSTALVFLFSILKIARPRP